MKKLCNFCQEIKVCDRYQFADGACDDCHEIDAYMEATNPDWCMWNAAQGDVPGYGGHTLVDYTPSCVDWLPFNLRMSLGTCVWAHTRVPVYLPFDLRDPFADE